MEKENAGPNPADAAYVANMRDVLRKRDVSALREFLVRSATVRKEPEEAAQLESLSHDALEARMHKMIMARMDLADLHDESRKWLIAHGFEPLR